ncbi:hypothetical protein ACOSQ3_009978 [Xanthoceras sorbifolium]
MTNFTFFTFIRQCHVLSKIRMESTKLRVEESTTELVIDPRMKSMQLAWNEEGIGEILKSCGDIQCLRIESCGLINSLGIKHFEVKKLEVLQVGASGIDHDALITIANTCPRLLYFNLSCCIYELLHVEKCKALREILLYFCRNVDANILPGIVFPRPSLRNIGWPFDEEISFPVYSIFDSIGVTDSGVIPLSRKLTSLTKMDLSGLGGITVASNDSFFQRSFVYVKGLCVIEFPKSPILDELLHWLANACLPLKKKTIGEAMRGLPNLVSVGLGGIRIASTDSFFQRSFACVKDLCVIMFPKLPISDELLHCLANASLPLKKYLSIVKSINLDICLKLINCTFFTLIRECHVLSEIRMKSTNLGVEEFAMELVIDPQIKSLHLAWNEEVIGAILKSCGEIQCFRIESSRYINNFRIKYFEVNKLEVLQSIEGDPLVFCRNVDANILPGIVFSMPSLRNIGWPSDEDISYLVYNIFDSIDMTDSGVIPLSRKLSSLTKIDLFGNKSITDKSIALISRTCHLIRFRGTVSC